MKHIINGAYNPLDLTEINRKKLEARHRGTTSDAERGRIHPPIQPMNAGRPKPLNQTAGHTVAEGSMAETFMAMLLNPQFNAEGGGAVQPNTDQTKKPIQETGTNSKIFPHNKQEHSNKNLETSGSINRFAINNPYLGQVVVTVTTQASGVTVNIQAQHALNKQQAHTLVQLVRVGLKSALNIEHLEVRID